EHLLSRGLRHFGFVAWAAVEDGISLWESRRQKVFVDAVRRAGFDASVYSWPTRPANRVWGREQKLLAKWLHSLPRPAGVMASNDQRARHVLEAARQVGLHIPDELAVIGDDDVEALCVQFAPSLSSLAHVTDTLCLHDAAGVDRRMQGRAVP